MSTSWTRFTVAGVVLAVAQIAAAQGTPPAPAPAPAKAAVEPKPADEHKALAPDAIKWGDAPPMLAKGAKLAVLYGDPGKDGLFIVRLKMPAGYKIMPHFHPTTENATVVSGALAVGMGDKLDPKTKAFPAGSFVSLPAG